MTGDPLRLLQAGDRLSGIPAAAWNEFVNAARFVRGLQGTGGVPGTDAAPGQGQVLVLNASGEDREQFDVLQLSEAVITPTASAQEFARRVALTGIIPDSDWAGSFVVLAEPIASGQIGRAWIDGACPARVNGGGEFCDTKDGEAGYLQAGDVGGARILWSESGEDERLAYVRLNDPRSFVLVRTVSGPDATAYPVEADDPTVYRCRMLENPSFPKSAGAGALTYTETDRYDYVKNLVSDHYIEEGSILGAFPLNGQLYTMDKLIENEELITFSEDASVAANPSLSRYKGTTGALIGSRVLTSTATYDIGPMRSDAAGNVYYVTHDLQGSTQGALYLRKTNRRCVQQWSVTLHADGDTIGTFADCEVTPDGKVYALTNGTLSGPVSTDEIDPLTYYVAKVAEYDTDGAVVGSWEVQTDAGGANIEASKAEATALAVRADGKIAVGVSINNYGPVGFGGTIVRSKSEVQLANADGSSAWRYAFEAITGGHTAGSPRGIACGTDGSVFCVRTASGGGHYVSKISAAGSLLWDKAITDYAASVVVTSFNRSICTDGDNNIYIGARHTSDSKFYTLKINGSTGAYIWHHATANTSYMTPFNDRGSRLAVRGGHVWAVNPTQAGGASTVPTLYKLERSTGAEAAAVNTIRSETACTIAPGRWPLFEA